MQVNRLYIVAAVILLVGLGLIAGCEDGQQGPMGPQGVAGTPRPIKLLLAGSDGNNSMRNMIFIAFRDRMFPLGSEIDYVNLTDSVPSLATLKKFDVIYVWSVNGFYNSQLTGDRLADYVDQGGRLVIAQFAYSKDLIGRNLTGRVMSPGYCPLLEGPVGGNNNNMNKKIAIGSLDFPLHPIFNYVHDDTLNYFAQSDLSDPGLDATATLLAKDTTGDNTIAINTKGNIIGLGLMGAWWFQDFSIIGPPPYPDGNGLIANCILWISGAY